MKQALKAEEIIVVDSGSTDATVSIASRYPTKILPMAPEEFSFGRSLNLGCREATAPLIVAASAHVYPVYEDWLDRLLAPFSDPHVALAYGKQRGGASTKYSEHRVFRKWFPDEPLRGQDHPFCNNANAALRRSVWDDLPYDETLTGLEEAADPSAYLVPLDRARALLGRRPIAIPPRPARQSASDDDPM